MISTVDLRSSNLLYGKTAALSSLADLKFADLKFSNALYAGQTVPLSSLAEGTYSSAHGTINPTNLADVNLTGTLIISMRLVSSRVTQVEIEKFELGEVSEAGGSSE